jgi:lysozyme
MFQLNRLSISAITLSASALVGLLIHEGYNNSTYIPIAGDKYTIGFGTTDGVKMGDTTTPVKALTRALQDVQKFEGALKNCVKVPLHQYEYDAFLGLTYNIGSRAFCSSTLVKKLNAQDYNGACKEILRWDRAGGRVVQGLTNRRQKEYMQCIGK